MFEYQIVIEYKALISLWLIGATFVLGMVVGDSDYVSFFEFCIAILVCILIWPIILWLYIRRNK